MAGPTQVRDGNLYKTRGLAPATQGDGARTLADGREAVGADATVRQHGRLVGCTASDITVTLATAMLIEGAWLVITDESGSAAATPITVATEGSETIDGAATASIAADHGTLRVYSDGSNWFSW